MFRNRFLSTAVCAALPMGTFIAGPAEAAGLFGEGEIAVLTVANPSGGDASFAAALGINFYDIHTGSLTQTIELPSFGSDAITLSGVVDHDGHLSVSTDRQYLLLGGYRADAGASNPVYESSSSVARVIGRIDAGAGIDTSTALTDAYDKTDINAVVSDNGERFWIVGEGKYLTGAVDGEGDEIEDPTTTGGLRYVDSLGDTVSVNLSQTQTLGGSLQPDAYRSAAIYDNQLYLFTASPESLGNRGAYTTADPLPIASVDTPQTMVGVITNIEGDSVNPGQQLAADPKGKQVPKTDLVLLDLDPTVDGYDTAYSTGGKDLVEKWALAFDDVESDYVWTQLSSTALPNDTEILAIESFVDSNGDVVLFASDGYGIFRVTDDAGYNLAFNYSAPSDYFITAGEDFTFRGLANVPEPTGLALLGLPTMFLIARRRRNEA